VGKEGDLTPLIAVAKKSTAKEKIKESKEIMRRFEDVLEFTLPMTVGYTAGAAYAR